MQVPPVEKPIPKAPRGQDGLSRVEGLEMAGRSATQIPTPNGAVVISGRSVRVLVDETKREKKKKKKRKTCHLYRTVARPFVNRPWSTNTRRLSDPTCQRGTQGSGPPRSHPSVFPMGTAKAKKCPGCLPAGKMRGSWVAFFFFFFFLLGWGSHGGLVWFAACHSPDNARRELCCPPLP